MDIDYNLSDEQKQQVQSISQKIHDRMETLWLERKQKAQLSTLQDAARILEEMGDVELANKVLNKTK